MKRKFISVALFGALLAASTSVTTSCNDYDDDIANLQGEITTNATNLDELVNEKVNNLNQEINSLKAQEATLETALATAKNELSVVIDEAAQGTKDYADIQAAAAQAAAIEAAQKGIADTRTVLEAGVADANARIDALNSQVTTQAGKIDALISADAALQSAIDIAKGQIAANKDLVAKAQSAAEAAQKAADAAQGTADAAQTTANGNANKITEVAGNLKAVEADLKGQISLLENKLNNKIDNVVSDIAKNKQDVEGQLTTVNSLLQTNAAAIEKLGKDVTAVDDKLEKEKNELLGKIAENSQSLIDLSGRLTTMQEALDAGLEAANTYTDTKVAKLKQVLTGDIDAVKADLATALSRLDGADQKIAAVEKAVEDLKAKDAELDKKDEALGKKDEELEAKYDDLVGFVSAISDETIPMLTGLIAQNTTLIGELEDKLGTLNGDLDALKGDHDALKGDHDALVKYAQALSAALEGHITEADAKAAIQDQSIEALQNVAAGLEERLSAVEVSAEKAHKAITDLTDDIAAYIVSNDKALKDLESKMHSNLDKAISDSKTELTTNLTAATTKLEGQISALETKISEDLRVKYNDLLTQIGAITGDEGVVSSLNQQIRDVDAKIGDLGEYKNLSERVDALLSKVEGKADKALDEIKEIYNQLNATNTTLGGYILTCNAELGRLCAALSTQLKSIVFKPEQYYQGIEAIGVESFNYNALTLLHTPDVSKDQTDDKVTSRATDETSVVPVVMASYHMNPSTAYIDTDKKHFSYVVNNATYTRAVGQNDITVDSVKLDAEKNGMFNVYFSMKDANKIEKIAPTGDSKVDVVALRYNYTTEEGKDTLITSDYAALKQYQITDFVINKVAKRGDVDNADPTSEGHLPVEAKDALAADAKVLEITYQDVDPFDSESGAKGIDLNEWINVHYKMNGGADQLWGGQETINEKKFKLVYELIGYKASDADNTNESQHATITDGHILHVHGVNGSPAGNRNIIGRKPLLRVKLVDENTNNQIAAVGYILVDITEVHVAPMAVDNIGAITDGYTVNCDNELVLKDKKAVTWVEVENEILGKLDMSKTEFEANYVLAYSDVDNKICQQYSEADVKKVMADPIGKIVNTTDPGEHETNILKWSVGNQQAYTLFKQEGKTSVSTWVLFQPKNTVPSQPLVFVKLTWAPSVINKTPKASIEDDAAHKKVADWHAADSREPGFKELHIQVGNATDPAATCEYQSMIVENTFNKKPVDIIKDAIRNPYSALADAVTVTYKFAPTAEQAKKTVTGADGTNYNVTVSPDGSEIFANNVMLASIDGTDGKITLVTNDDVDDVVKNIINASENVGDALNFTVWASHGTCVPAENLIAVDNAKFNVKVIKPIYLKEGKVADMTLNDYSSLTQKLSLSFVDFNDYDPLTFYEKSNKQKTFWDFYGVTSITLDDRAGWETKTDYSGMIKAVDEGEFTVDFTTPTGTISLNNMGTVTLTQKNNMSRANSFNVWLNLKVTYKWGTLYKTVKLHVNKAPGNRSINR